MGQNVAWKSYKGASREDLTPVSTPTPCHTRTIDTGFPHMPCTRRTGSRCDLIRESRALTRGFMGTHGLKTSSSIAHSPRPVSPLRTVWLVVPAFRPKVVVWTTWSDTRKRQKAARHAATGMNVYWNHASSFEFPPRSIGPIVKKSD